MAKKPVINTENKVEMEFKVQRVEGVSADVADVRRTIEEAAKQIPEAALKSLRSFRLVLVA